MTNILLLFIGLIILSGCGGAWTVSKPLPYAKEDIWNASYYVISRRYNIITASKEEGEIETDWKYNMSLFYLESFRDKVRLKLEPYVPSEEESMEDLPPVLENDFSSTSQSSQAVSENSSQKNKDSYVIKVQVTREQNRNIDNPALISEAAWHYYGNNVEEEKRLLSFIIARLALKYPVSPIPWEKENSPPKESPFPSME